MSETPSLADRRRTLLRAEIGRVAIELFAEQGFDAVTVDDIAAAAGTSPRTFFRYFATKDDIVLDYERHLYDRLLVALDQRPASEGAVTALRESYRITSHVEPAGRARVVQLGRILEAAPGLRARGRGERLLRDEELVKRVAARLQVPSDDTRARVIVAAMDSVAGAEFRAWVADGGRGDPADRIVAALALVEDGLSTLEHRRSKSSGRPA